MAQMYNGSMKLPTGIAADGSFPVVNISEVYVSGDPTDTWTNLSTKLSAMNATISSIDTKVGSIATTGDIKKLFEKEA